ncbi:MAG: hypothetical protein ACYDAG_00170 [Chloroflexota bacterium]
MKTMKQIFIDSDKVNAWTASMREAFGGGSNTGTWVTIGIITMMLLLVIWSVWPSRRHTPKSGR